MTIKVALSKMAVEALKARRSIRNFDPTYEITKEQMDTIVECALNSPTALNKQGNNLIIITNKETIAKIDAVALDSVNDQIKERFLTRQKRYSTKNPVTCDCSALILIVKNERSSGCESVDCGIMAMSIMAAAQGLGLWSVPLGIIARPQVEEVVGIEKGSVRLGVAIGKPKCIDVDKKEIQMKVKYIK